MLHSLHKALGTQGLLVYTEALILYLCPAGAEDIFCVVGLLLFDIFLSSRNPQKNEDFGLDIIGYIFKKLYKNIPKNIHHLYGFIKVIAYAFRF